MNISAADIARLRKTTGSGMMDCKEALNETNGDFEAAIDFLRKKGQKISAKRADREANEGIVIAQTSQDHTFGVVVEVNCETDFVAKNSDFVAFVQKIADTALASKPINIEELLNLPAGNVKVSDLIDEQLAKIGEKIELANYRFLHGDCIVPYIHMGYKIGVLVSLNKPKNDNIINIGKDVAMQVAAMNPVAVDKDFVAQSYIDRELEIGREVARTEGKPENMIEKIAQGKLGKFFKENTLLNQDFVKDGSKSVDEALKLVEKDLTVTEFVRLAITS